MLTPEKEQQIREQTADLVRLITDPNYARLLRELASAMQQAVEQRRSNGK